MIINNPSDPSVTTSGSFVVGSAASFFWTFTDIFGVLFDPSDIDVSIFDSSDTLIKLIEAGDRIETGVFVVQWAIPTTTTPGRYSAVIEYVVETDSGPVTRTFTEYFAVLETGQGVVSLRSIATRAFLESLIGTIQRIPVFNELARLNRARTTGTLSFQKWNQTADVKMLLNGDVKESGFEVDYVKGKITFDNPLSLYDTVRVSYNFRWFEDSELDGFLEQGANIVNIYAPQSVYTIGNMPDRWLIAAEYSAAINVYRRWMTDILFQEPAKIFGSLERADKVFTNLETVKQNYEKELKDLLDQKKYGPYVGLTKSVTVPEFTLPGGRSRWFRYLFKGGL